jgi:hypothetical protein
MSRKLDFIADEVDICALVDFIASRGGVIVPYRRGTSDLESRAPHEFLLGDGSGWIVREQDVDDLVSYYLPEPNAWFLEYFGNPAIQFAAPVTGDGLRHGAMRYAPTYFDASGKRSHLPEDFVVWADEILRWVRRAYRKGPDGWTREGPSVRAKRLSEQR